jgi:CheY-like chemotaxis protein
MASTIRIGLLDTDSDVRFGRKLVLSSQANFEVVFDSDGSAEDIEAIEQSLIDVLVLDQRLTCGSGVSFYSSLRNLTGVKQAPSAILTTSFEQPELLLDALHEGILDVVTVEQGAPGGTNGYRFPEESRRRSPYFKACLSWHSECHHADWDLD